MAAPAAAPAPKPAPPAPPAATPSPVPPARSGEVHDVGAARHDFVHAARWSAQGAVKVLGEVDVGSAELGGLATVRGALRAGSLSSKGTLDVAGTAEVANALRLEGEAEFGATLRAGAIVADGAVRVRGALSATESLRSVGSLEVHGPLSAPTVSFDGRLLVDGELTAREVTGTLRDDSSVHTIRAERVTIRRGVRFGRRRRLSVTLLEAREVTLEDVDVEYLKADRIALGAGAQVARAEGAVVSRHPTAHVGPVSRSPPPYGLFR